MHSVGLLRNNLNTFLIKPMASVVIVAVYNPIAAVIDGPMAGTYESKYSHHYAVAPITVANEEVG